MTIRKSLSREQKDIDIFEIRAICKFTYSKYAFIASVLLAFAFELLLFSVNNFENENLIGRRLKSGFLIEI